MLDRPASKASDWQAVIRVRGLEAGFDDHLVLKGVDLDLYRGEILGLVGASARGSSMSSS
jgi:phospholipid/cholesterol/gamma-HCH transport system ATP-binding protein